MDGTSPQGDAPTQGTETVESLMARLSGKDTAHARAIAAKDAENAALAKERDDLRSAKEAAEAQAAKAAEEAATAKATARKALFPLAADTLGDDHLAQMDEATLSRMEQRLGAVGDTPGIVLPSSSQRPIGGEKPLADKSSAELRADLEREAPDFLSRL